MFIDTLDREGLKSFEIELPAAWIEDGDRDWAFQTRILLDTMIDHFKEAVVAFAFYEPIDLEKKIHRGPDGEIVITRDKWKDVLRSVAVKMFVSALDGIGKIMKVIREDKQAPLRAVDACKELEQQFAIVKEIRDSQQHMDERCRGLARGKQINSNILLLGTWKDGKHFFVASDGKQYGIEISEAVLRMIQVSIERLIWAFEWIGPGNTLIKKP